MSKGGKPRRTGRASSLGALSEMAFAFSEARTPSQVISAGRTLLAALVDPGRLTEEVGRAVRDAEAEMRKRILSLEADLCAACAKHGWSLDGVWPAFYIEKAIEVRIDEAASTARVGAQSVALEVESIIEVAAPIVRQLFPRTFSGVEFLSGLARAIDTVAKPGEAASLARVYRELVIDAQPARFWRDARAELFVPISIEQLRARLSRMLASQACLSDGRSLRISPPVDSKDGLFVWQPAEHRFGYVGWFRLVEGGAQ